MIIRYQIVQFLNALWIYILCFVLLGAYIYQFYEHQEPCSLCELQRLSMILLSIGPILNIRFGICAFHYGLSLMASVFGGTVSLRHIALHICPDFPTFGYSVFGFELYTWAFFVFGSSILSVVFFLFLYSSKNENIQIKIGVYEYIAIILMLVIALANTVTTILQCGIGPCSEV